VSKLEQVTYRTIHRFISVNAGDTAQWPTARNDDSTRCSAASRSELWALCTLSTAQKRLQRNSDFDGVRQPSVKNSDTEFHDNTPNTLAADTKSVTDGRKWCPEKAFQFVTSSRQLTKSEESNQLNVKHWTCGGKYQIMVLWRRVLWYLYTNSLTWIKNTESEISSCDQLCVLVSSMEAAFTHLWDLCWEVCCLQEEGGCELNSLL